MYKPSKTSQYRQIYVKIEKDFGALCNMANKVAKFRALRMYFKEGFKCPDIASALSVPVRSVQRWIKECNVNEIDFSSDQELISETSVAAIEEIRVHPLLKSDGWYGEAESLAQNHFTSHNSIRVKLEKLLHEQLELPELNLRSIHCLSLGLSRHIEGERQAASLHLLDINKACRIVENYGLKIVNEKEEYD